MNGEHLAAMLAGLKDTSEIMVDLAYSALIYGREEIADYVLTLEEEMDRRHTEFELAVLELREKRPARGLLGLIRLALAAEELADAAALIADIVKRGVRAHPIARIALEKAEETIVFTEVAGDSVMAGKSLGELRLEDEIGMRIIAVRRGESWTYNPPESFVISRGDLIIARGYSEGREKLLSLANPLDTNKQ
jgi:uncharacterized protein with PhoU and TrkA domain